MMNAQRRMEQRDREVHEKHQAADERVSDWFWEWVPYHTELNQRSDWEDLIEGRIFWANWRLQFVLHGLHDEDVAYEASERVSVEELKHKADHLRKLLKASKDIYRERYDRDSGNDLKGNIKGAADASAGCLDCGGGGWATRYRHKPPQPGQEATIRFYCVCPLGRAMKANHEANEEANLWGRVPDLLQFKAFQRRPVPWSDKPDNKFCWHPDTWDRERNRPIDSDMAALKALVRRGARGITANGSRMVAREPAATRAAYTANQQVFLSNLGPHWRAVFDAAPGDVRAAILAQFDDDAKPYDRDAADRMVRVLSDCELRSRAAPASPATDDQAGEGMVRIDAGPGGEG